MSKLESHNQKALIIIQSTISIDNFDLVKNKYDNQNVVQYIDIDIATLLDANGGQKERQCQDLWHHFFARFQEKDQQT